MKGATPDANKIKFYYRRDKDGNPLSMFEPNTTKISNRLLLLAKDGFMDHAKDSTIYIFAYLIRNIPGSIFPFEDLGVSLIAFTLKEAGRRL